jgi:voltage-gated potassium channel
MVVDLGAKEAECMSATNKVLTRAQRQRGITLGLLRALGVSAVLIALYYLAPLDQLAGISLLLSLIIGLLVLAAMTAYQVWAILRAAHPGVRAVEALATTVLLFLLLFAATYFLMSHTSTSNFNVHALTRTDSIYFTVTVFATVGFGDISPASQVARLVVTAQMIFNLIVLGLGVRLIVGAVQQARQDNPDGRNRKLAPDRASA